jgi:hypothetical protein
MFDGSQRLRQTLGDQSPNAFEVNFPADHSPASAV